MVGFVCVDSLEHIGESVPMAMQASDVVGCLSLFLAIAHTLPIHQSHPYSIR